jgi:hypothetical protein
LPLVKNTQQKTPQRQTRASVFDHKPFNLLEFIEMYKKNKIYDNLFFDLFQTLFSIFYSRCGCGRPKDKHTKEAIENFQKAVDSNSLPNKWDYSLHTVQDDLTDAYGDIKFLGVKNKNSKVTYQILLWFIN